MARRRRLGEVLVDGGLITDEELAQALEAQNSGEIRRRLGATLVDLDFVSETDIADALAGQLGFDRVDLDHVTPEVAAISRVPGDVARRHQVMPLRLEEDDTLVVAMADPTNVVALDELRMTTRVARVVPMVATDGETDASIKRYYSGTAAMAQSDDYGLEDEEDSEEAFDNAEIESKPIVRLANTLIVDAVRLRASDIHVEPTRGDVRVRFRVDGILTEVMKVPRPARAPLTSRLKLMAGMDISERRRPQDGRTAVTVHGQAVDLRVSSMPSMHGEKIVLRLLRRGGERLDLDDLRLAPDVHREILEALDSPQGIVLITGPTGSGKTTTVYAGLAEVATITRNVITLEDPIEYELDLVNQTQVNPRIGFSFAVGMRTVLRQDPDVIMVGEIRDGETAELAFEAAMTGHLVLSTVHTNNAPSTVLRMSELGVERHLIASSMSLIIAQRLVRVVCKHCAELDTSIPAKRLLRRLRLDPQALEGVTTRRRGRGCIQCADTGFMGRASVTEALVVTPRIADLITDGARESTIRNIAREEGMRSMRQDGLIKVMQGLTTLEEVLRATPDDPRLDATALVRSMAAGGVGYAPFVVERRRAPRSLEEAQRGHEETLADDDGMTTDVAAAHEARTYPRRDEDDDEPVGDEPDQKAEPDGARGDHEDDVTDGEDVIEGDAVRDDAGQDDTREDLGPDLAEASFDEPDPDELDRRADALMTQAEEIMTDPEGRIDVAERLIDEADGLTRRAAALRVQDLEADPAEAHTG